MTSPPSSNERDEAVAARRARAGVLWKFLLLSWLLMLANTGSYLLHVRFLSALATGWVIVVWLTYSFFYLLPVFAPLLLLNRVLSSAWVARKLPSLVRASGALLGAALLGASLAQMVIFADAIVFRMFNFHFNGFVWNLVTTRGGIESMGASGSTQISFALIALGWLLAEAVLLRIAQRSQRFDRLRRSLLPRAAVVASLVVVLPLVSVAERVTYGLADSASYGPVLTAANTFPLYVPVRMPRLGKKLGFAVDRTRGLDLKVDTVHVHYPLQPIARAPGHRDWNVVWLVSESLRADMLDPEIMPATSAFAARAADFRSHYSGGNGTRMGMFSMFYGLYGSYWFSFLNETRGPALLDLLLDQGYQTYVYTSARFSYPEFDKTIFRRIASAQLHEGEDGIPGWENDRRNVTRMLADIDGRDAARPFFAFMFFESPHAQYYFPPESVIRRPYLENFNYATTDIAANIGLIKNRYINACHHLDSQFARVFENLQQRGLLDSTIVVITGDHGEQFMEKGHWGHHATFVDEEIRVPLVIWAPGVAPRRETRMSSHLDIVPTLMTLLGVTNPAADYSLGHDLFGAERPERCVIADWDRLACVSRAGKVILPVNYKTFGRSEALGPDDSELEGAAQAELLASQRSELVAVMKNLSRFSR
jgi:membrane-anchored protein YejM (alkaline phosphatase superfamily)